MTARHDASQGPLAVADELIARLGTTRTEPGTEPRLEALAIAVAGNLPVLLWGEPGIGKSAVLTQLAEDLEVPLETVIASIHEPSDFAGLPIIGETPELGVPMAPPDWAVRVAKAGRGLVFFDELSAAPPAVQAALLRVVLERRVGSLQLPAAVRIVAAANPPSSAADGWHLSPPLANRFVHLRWTHDPRVVARGLSGVWPRLELPRVDASQIQVAIAKARGAVAAFLYARPGLVHHMPKDAESRGGAWPSPRTWDMALRLLALSMASPRCSPEAVSSLLVGVVGEGAGLELSTFLDELDLPNPDRVLADPEAFTLPSRGDRQLAVLTSIVAAVEAENTQPRWHAAWVVLAQAVDAGIPDVAARAAIDLARLRDPAWDAPPQVTAFVEVLRLSGVRLGG